MLFYTFKKILLYICVHVYTHACLCVCVCGVYRGLKRESDPLKLESGVTSICEPSDMAFGSIMHSYY